MEFTIDNAERQRRVMAALTADDAVGGENGPALGPIRPHYTGYGIVNLPWTALDALRVPHDRQGLAPELLPAGLLDDIRVVVVLVIDALGYNQLDRAMSAGDAPTLRELSQRQSYFPLSSTFPSTTVAALTALQTGEPPARHGLAGYTCYLRELGMLTDLIRFLPAGRMDIPVSFGVEPPGFLPVPTIYARAAAAGVETTVVSYALFQDTPLTRLHSDGVEYYGYRTLAEFGAQIRRAVARPGRRLVGAYWPMVDLIGHDYGPEADVSRSEIRLLDAMLRRDIVEGLRDPDVLVMLTADHGQVQLDPARAVNLSDSRELLDELSVPPAGERRLGYFHARPGRVESVRARLEEIAGDGGAVVTGEQLIAGGWYGPGPVYDELPHRIGALALVARGASSFPAATGVGSVTPMLGAHAALEADEMVVPCLVWRGGL